MNRDPIPGTPARKDHSPVRGRGGDLAAGGPSLLGGDPAAVVPPAPAAPDRQAPQVHYQLTPSGGIPDVYCVHAEGAARNVIKHVPYDVAVALQAYLNGTATVDAVVPLAAYILAKHGHLPEGELPTERS